MRDWIPSLRSHTSRTPQPSVTNGRGLTVHHRLTLHWHTPALHYIVSPGLPRRPSPRAYWRLPRGGNARTGRASAKLATRECREVAAAASGLFRVCFGRVVAGHRADVCVRDKARSRRARNRTRQRSPRGNVRRVRGGGIGGSICTRALRGADTTLGAGPVEALRRRQARFLNRCFRHFFRETGVDGPVWSLKTRHKPWPVYAWRQVCPTGPTGPTGLVCGKIALT